MLHPVPSRPLPVYVHVCYCVMLQARMQAPSSCTGWKRVGLVDARNCAVAFWDMPSTVASCGSGSVNSDCARAHAALTPLCDGT